MKILNTLSVFTVMILVIFTVSCGSDSESCTPETAASEFFTKALSFASIESAYQDDPVANCAEYKAALEDLIAFMEANESCLDQAGLVDENGDPASISSAIATAKSNLAAVDC